MKPVLKIDPPEWLKGRNVQKLLSLLNDNRSEAQTLLVGGCVRNTLMDHPVSDLDLATIHMPEKVTEILEDANVKVIPTGLDHGTVTAVLDGQSFEITTLRKDVETDGRHAQVTFTDNWAEDASRRDFTINAIYMNGLGQVFDPLDIGINDTKLNRIVFIDNPAQRIEEDVLRILRFFRFYGAYGKGDPDQASSKACRDAANKIESLSKERITQEFLKIIALPDSYRILGLMFESSVMADIAHENYKSEIMKRLAAFQDDARAVNLNARLLVLIDCDLSHISRLKKYLRLANDDWKDIQNIAEAFKHGDFESEKGLKETIYWHGRDVTRQAFLSLCAQNGGENVDQETFLSILQNWGVPVFPVKGEDLIAEGFKPCPELGAELKRRERDWLQNIIKEL